MNSVHKNTIVFILLSFLFQSCQVYQSPERKEFESESPQFRVQNLQKISCSQTSVSSQSPAIVGQKIILETETERIWEFIIADVSVFESENLQGEYCVLSYSHEST
jgi:hypothetical protein